MYWRCMGPVGIPTILKATDSLLHSPIVRQIASPKEIVKESRFLISSMAWRYHIFMTVIFAINEYTYCQINFIV